MNISELEQMAHYLMSRQLDAGKEAARDSIVDELIQKQGIDPEDADIQTKEIANQAAMKIFESYNFSGKELPAEGFWRRPKN
jgi:hypothetical protein